MTPSTPAPLDVQRIRDARFGRRIGSTVEYRATTESTNTDAQRLARDGAGEGTVVVADSQSRGRGRLGRSWTSPPSLNLYLSLVLRPPVSPAQAPQLGLMAGVAAAEALRDWCPRAALKWPNDVLIDGRKVCGILTEMETAEESVAFVVVGIGVNLNIAPEEFPAELRDKATSLAAATGGAVDRSAFTIRLLERLESLYDRYLAGGFATVREEWERLCPFLGQPLGIDDGQRRFRGTALGLDEDGALRLRVDDGTEVRVVAGDVTVLEGYAARH